MDSNDLELEDLPTGKKHISFSEVREWKDCSYRHRLKHVKKIDLSKPGALMDFGTAVHASCEDFLKTRSMNIDIALSMIDKLWEANKAHAGYDEKSKLQFKIEATAILEEVPGWLEETFPNWEFVDSEHFLYEKIEKHPHAFKGFIDCIIKTKDKKGKTIIWLIDWKTTSWGWKLEKKTNEMTKAQLVLYKNYWANKTNEDPKNIKCGFVLLKRTAKQGTRCELVPVSVGGKTTSKSLKIVNDMVSCVKKGIAIKNRNSCMYCEYKDTEHCT